MCFYRILNFTSLKLCKKLLYLEEGGSRSNDPVLKDLDDIFILRNIQIEIIHLFIRFPIHSEQNNFGEM